MLNNDGPNYGRSLEKSKWPTTAKSSIRTRSTKRSARNSIPWWRIPSDVWRRKTKAKIRLPRKHSWMNFSKAFSERAGNLCRILSRLLRPIWAVWLSKTVRLRAVLRLLRTYLIARQLAKGLSESAKSGPMLDSLEALGRERVNQAYRQYLSRLHSLPNSTSPQSGRVRSPRQRTQWPQSRA